MPDSPERLTFEGLYQFASKEEAMRYLSEVERRGRVMEDHGSRIQALEVGFASLRGDMQGLAKETAETRVSVLGALNTVASEQKAIAHELTLEAGRKEGRSKLIAALVLIGSLFFASAVGLSIYTLRSFVRDVLAEVQQEVNR